MDRKEIAAQLHSKKHTCAQSVAGAFADRVDLDQKTMFRVMEGFGLGMGNMEGTCGALSGAMMLAGIVNSDGDLEDPGTKASTYKLCKQIYAYFHEHAGASLCKDLKGVETGTPLCSCPRCIDIAVEAVEEVLKL